MILKILVAASAALPKSGPIDIAIPAWFAPKKIANRAMKTFFGSTEQTGTTTPPTNCYSQLSSMTQPPPEKSKPKTA